MGRSCRAANAAVWVFVCFSLLSSPVEAQSLPDPWLNRDIGSPVLAGSARAESSSFVIDAAGEGIGDSRDQFHFVYQPVIGDADIKARIDDLVAADDWSKAGVMIRASLTADAAHAFMLVSAANGTAFQRRAGAGGATASTAGPARRRWVRLVRTGATVTAYTSPNGSNWSMVGQDTVSLGATAFIGIAVSSHDPGVRTTAAVSNLSVIIKSAPPGQLSTDVGSPSITGQTTYDAGRYRVTAGGSDIGGTEDEFHFVYQPVTGDVDVMARVESIGNSHPRAMAGVMIRETLDAPSRHVLMAATRSAGWISRRRVDTGAMSEETSGGKGTPPGWVRLVRSGPLVEAYRSADGRSWSLVETSTVPMNDVVYVGLAVASHNPTRATAAVLDNLQIVESRPPANQAPVVTITSPGQGQSFVAPATVTIAASASDADGTIIAVDFYSGTILLGRDTSAPYAFSVPSLPAGTYALKALAIDDRGATTMSSSVTVTVTAEATDPSAGDLPQGIAFLASADHATIVNSYRLEVYGSGTTPGTTPPIAFLDLGKPIPTSTGEITVFCGSFFEALLPGDYIATVSAIASTGTARSEGVSFSR